MPLNLRAGIEPCAWILGKGGVSRPGGDLCIIGDQREGSFFGLIASCSNPYSIEGLVSSDFRLGYRSPAHSLWLEWCLLHCSVYREDRFSLSFGRYVLGKRFLLGLSPSLDRRRIIGYVPESRGSLSASVACVGAERLAAKVEAFSTLVPRSRFLSLEHTLSLSLGHLVLIIGRTVRESARSETASGVEIGIGEGVSLLSGYRWSTEELSAAALFYNSKYMTCISFCHHPDLGATFSVSVGRFWGR